MGEVGRRKNIALVLDLPDKRKTNINLPSSIGIPVALSFIILNLPFTFYLSSHITRGTKTRQGADKRNFFLTFHPLVHGIPLLSLA